jgi:nucleoside-diphosphate-sugar epimerase
VYACVKEADLILHVAAFVSPAADYHPQQAMKINYGSMRNLIGAIQEQGRTDSVKLAAIGRSPRRGTGCLPSMGAVGDPIKPSMFDYYAVSRWPLSVC